MKGPEEDVDTFKKRLVGHSPWPQCQQPGDKPNLLNFHNLVPIPVEVLAAGDAAGHEWEREHWGCRYGASETRIIDEWKGWVIYEFETAWAPPTAFLETVAKQWPTLVMILEYEELGMGFKGIAKFEGENHEDHCLQL